jgi:hypothetical protein
VDVKSILLEALGVEARRRDRAPERSRATAMSRGRAVVVVAIIVALVVIFGPAVVLIIQNKS